MSYRGYPYVKCNNQDFKVMDNSSSCVWEAYKLLGIPILVIMGR
jgi:hypothetical protein